MTMTLFKSAASNCPSDGALSDLAFSSTVDW